MEASLNRCKRMED